MTEIEPDSLAELTLEDVISGDERLLPIRTVYHASATRAVGQRGQGDRERREVGVGILQGNCMSPGIRHLPRMPRPNDLAGMGHIQLERRWTVAESGVDECRCQKAALGPAQTNRKTISVDRILPVRQ